MNKLISFIIPVYNVGANLERCLCSINLSIYELRKSEIDGEVIIVYDGGKYTDSIYVKSWLSSLTEYISHDIVAHEKNKGVSAARNTGLMYAKGDWVWFIDADDYINHRDMSKLSDALLGKGIYPSGVKDCEIIQLGAHEINEYEEDSLMYFSMTYNDVCFLTNSELIERSGLIPPSVCCKLINRKFLIDNNIKFNEELTVSEERPFLVDCYLNKARAVCLRIAPYYYIRNEWSLTKSTWGFRKYFDSYLSVKLCKDKLDLNNPKLSSRLTEYSNSLKLADANISEYPAYIRFIIKLVTKIKLYFK